MSAFELRLSLPCNPATWEAESADQWYNHFKNEKETSFLTVLKIYVNPGSALPPAQLNALSRLLIFHGLMSISWDMKRREQTSLGFTGPTAQDRQNRLADSYDAWKADFDTYCMSMTMSLKDNPHLKKIFTQFSTATTAIFHAAHIILNVEILDLQIYAGARHIIGRSVTRADYDRSRRILKQWAQPCGSQAAVKASWHAAHLLRDGIMNLDNWDVNDVFHYPWCLYLATLTCWGFHFSSGDKNDKENGAADAMQLDDIVWDAQAEMNALVSGMTSVTPEGLWKTAGKYATCGLTAVMGKHLSSIRWAVVHEGMKILRGLVAERRINEYESLLR
jgi:Fungal specific transcription factor domain